MTYLKLAVVAAFLAIFVLGPQSVFAAEIPVNDTQIEYTKVDRTVSLKKFLQRYNSPLVENAADFIKTADKYKIDYRILPAISCMESTCGKFLIPGTFNPFGWGVGRIPFTSYSDAIARVGDGMYKIYYSKGLDTPETIAPVYDPPSPQTWSKGVRFFMNQMAEAE